MPIYEYECSKCGKTFEVIQKMSDDELKKHEKCGGKLTKSISASAFQFKGTGWYVTDYARKGKDSSKEASSNEKKEGTTDTKSDSTKAPKKDSSSKSGGSKANHLRIARIIEGLEAAYPDAKCALDHENALQLLVATIMSAQSTDKMVNTITPALFRRYKNARQFADADTAELETMIHSSGFFRNKAKSIKAAAHLIAEKHGGSVPQTMEELLELPGVARKTANVVLGVAFEKAEGVVVDTHVQRLSRRLDLSKEERPEKIEQDLMRIVPREKWIEFSHLLIHHGRQKCAALRPKCAECPIEHLCYSDEKTV